MERCETYDRPQPTDVRSPILLLLIGGIALVGIWARFWSLGDRPIAEDEYYFIRSAQYILENGIPQFPSGGYYVRGLLPQYLTAGSIFLFGDGGFAYRLQSAFFGTLTLAMAYLLGRRFLNRSWSFLLVALLAFSSWQIEFSRFARMYSAFQFVATCFFWSLYRYAFDGTSAKRYVAVAVAVIAVLTHELGVIVTIFLLIPLPAWFEGDWRKLLAGQRGYIAASLAAILFGLFMAFYPFRFVGVLDPLPSDYIWPLSRVVPWYSFGVELFGGVPFFAAGALASAALMVWYLQRTARNVAGAAIEEHVLGGLLVLAVCSAFFHQFALSVVFLLAVVLRQPALPGKKPYRYLLVLWFALFACWSSLLVGNQVWTGSGGIAALARAFVKAFRTHFLALPDLYSPIIKAWAESIPVLGVLLAAALAAQLLRSARGPVATLVKNPVIPVIMVLLVFGFDPPELVRTRYSYFLFPLMLCIGLLSACQLGEFFNHRFAAHRRLPNLGIVICVLLFAASEEFNLSHWLNLNSPAVAFRTGAFERFSSHWYPRMDCRRPAELVNAEASSGSRVIITGRALAAAAYLQKDFAVFWHREGAAFPAISREGGTRELWSDRYLLGTNEEVMEHTQHAEEIWLVSHAGWDSLDPKALWPDRALRMEVFRPGLDKRIEVWRIKK